MRTGLPIRYIVAIPVCLVLTFLVAELKIINCRLRRDGAATIEIELKDSDEY